MKTPSLKTRCALELLTLGILTTIFLFVFPYRSTLVDVSLAFFALIVLALNARFTRNAIWAQFPPRGRKSHRVRDCLISIAAITLAVVLVFFGIGLGIGYAQNCWATALARVSNWHILLAICF
jgi:hypothetical protein